MPACPVDLQLGICTVIIDTFQCPDFLCIQSKVLKVNFFKGFQLFG